MSLSVFSPISMGNVNVGFDTLGIALAPIDGTLVGDFVHIKPLGKNAIKDQFILTGSHAHKLPANKESNIAWLCLLAFNQKLDALNIKQQSIELTLEKNIPVSSGLGSSGCSVVASLFALNEFYNQPLNQLELLTLMGELESRISGGLHYDNVAPTYLGGLQLMSSDNNKITQSLPVFDDVYWVIAYPDIEISTKSAREILPKSYERQTAITFARNLAGFIDASYRKDKQQAFFCLTDVIAEPYRKNLLPNFDLAKTSLKQLGALATGISGSGPSLFCATDDLSIAQKSSDWLKANYLQSKDGFVYICKADLRGTRKIEPS